MKLLLKLNAAGCKRIFREKASGGRWDRPELHWLLDQLRKDDVLNALPTLTPVVWKLDRLYHGHARGSNDDADSRGLR